MNQQNHGLPILFSIALLTAMHGLQGAVVDITGDTGSPQSGSVALSGGSSGSVFDSTTSTITQSFNFISLPFTTSTNGQILIGTEPVLHNYGIGNKNIFAGSFAGNFTTTGSVNAGFGESALNSLTTGLQNSAVGHAALINLTEGLGNTAVGEGSGGGLTTGNINTLYGVGAGAAYMSSESNNIIIGSNPGVINENFTIRIGGGQTQQDCYIDGIYSSTIDFDSALPVFVDDVGKLGTILSSANFKNNIHDILDDSLPILNLRPVSFYLKSDPKKIKQFGLIAEEVYKVFPELVVLDKNGHPFAVRYHELPVLLLNELQKKAAHIQKLQDQLNKLTARINRLEACFNHQ